MGFATGGTGSKACSMGHVCSSEDRLICSVREAIFGDVGVLLGTAKESLGAVVEVEQLANKVLR
jgi:hypothetical protein